MAAARRLEFAGEHLVPLATPNVHGKMQSTSGSTLAKAILVTRSLTNPRRPTSDVLYHDSFEEHGLARLDLLVSEESCGANRIPDSFALNE